MTVPTSSPPTAPEEAGPTSGRNRPRFSPGPLLLLLSGVVLLAVLARSHRPSFWRPVRLPLLHAGRATAEFQPVPNLPYEVEIELRDPRLADLPAARARRATDWIYANPLPAGTPTWEIRTTTNVQVAGDAQEPAYLEIRLPTWRGRLRDALFFLPFQRDATSRRTFGLAGGGTLSRGLGHFRTGDGGVFLAAVTPGPLAEEFAGLEPSFNIRVARQEWNRHWRRAVPLALAGYLSLFSAGAWWLGRRLGRRGRHSAAKREAREGDD